MQLEIAELDLRHASLRIDDRTRTQRLVASMCEAGQQAPVLVVRGAGERWVLIDGYARVQALRLLARDVVEAVALELPEADALVMGYALDHSRPRSALEDGWLLAELRDGHGLGLLELALKLDRSKSWVSRRLALVQALPPSVQAAVQCGRVVAQIATKFLVPLARANRAQCERLVVALGDERLTVRQAQRLYTAWSTGDTEQRERLVEHPLLFLRADAATRTEGHVPADDEVAAAIGDLGAVAGLCVRARMRLCKQGIAPAEAQRLPLQRAFVRARQAFGSLSAVLEEEVG
jgi:ParB family chromosome partitioning protein